MGCYAIRPTNALKWFNVWLASFVPLFGRFREGTPYALLSGLGTNNTVAQRKGCSSRKSLYLYIPNPEAFTTTTTSDMTVTITSIFPSPFVLDTVINIHVHHK
ncbi:hypothetical protein AB1N83_008387 [Pleurotus pulmonarius]